jgi:FkbM family methyltransferase
VAGNTNVRDGSVGAARRRNVVRVGPLAMSAREYVDTLYRLCLGRAAEYESLAAWTSSIEAGGDPTALLAGILASDEYRNRLAAPDKVQCAQLAEIALNRLGRRPRIVDVGAQSLGDGSHPYSPLSALTATDIVGFDPLATRLEERAAHEATHGSLQLLPFALGDGHEHTLYVNNVDATSSLFPLDIARNASFPQLARLQTIRTEQVKTRRLDDVLPHGPVDFLKLDVQGAELMVLRGGPKATASAAVVHCEVEFSPLYEGQPLYPEIHQELSDHGFALIDMLVSTRYFYRTSSGATSPDRLIWADAVFYRDTADLETLAVQALISAAVYAKPALAEYLLDRAGSTT